MLPSNTQLYSKNLKGLNVKILLLSFHGPLPLKICDSIFPGHSFLFYFFKTQPLFQYYYRHTICSPTFLSLHLLSSPILSRLSSKFVSFMCILGLICKIHIQSQVISHHFHYYHLDSSHHHLFQRLFVRVSNLSLCFYSCTSKSILHTLKSYYITSLLRTFY